MQRVLLVANQPFEIRFFQEVASLLQSRVEVGLAVVDLYTFNYALDVLDESTPFFSLGIKTLQEEFLSWQKTSSEERIEKARETISWFAAALQGERDIDTIRLTDIYTNNFEFSAWHKPVSSKWRDIAHADMITWSTAVLNEIRPDLIVALDNSLLPNSVIYELSLQRSIPHWTISNSRFYSRWIKRLDFNYGISENLATNIRSNTFTNETWRLVSELIQQYESNSVSELYNSGTIQSQEFALKWRRNSILPILYLAMRLPFWFLHSIRSISHSPRNRRFKAKRFDQDVFKLMWFEFKRDVFPAFRYNNFPREVRGNYFLFPLHYRPEGVVLVQGKGLDEIQLIMTVAQKLPENTFLLVRENPQMVGMRKKYFYEEIKNIAKVKLAPIHISNKELIAKSLAVVGLAGTSLMEAQMLGVPSWTLGSPEFSKFLQGAGWDGLELFLEVCANSDSANFTFDIKYYLAWVIENSSEGDSFLRPDKGISELKQDTSRVAKYILDHFLNCTH